jgi:hypothetical protein
MKLPKISSASSARSIWMSICDNKFSLLYVLTRRCDYSLTAGDNTRATTRAAIRMTTMQICSTVYPRMSTQAICWPEVLLDYRVVELITYSKYSCLRATVVVWNCWYSLFSFAYVWCCRTFGPHETMMRPSSFFGGAPVLFFFCRCYMCWFVSPYSVFCYLASHLLVIRILSWPMLLLYGWCTSANSCSDPQSCSAVPCDCTFPMSSEISYALSISNFSKIWLS